MPGTALGSGLDLGFGGCLVRSWEVMCMSELHSRFVWGIALEPGCLIALEAGKCGPGQRQVVLGGCPHD